MASRINNYAWRHALEGERYSWTKRSLSHTQHVHALDAYFWQNVAREVPFLSFFFYAFERTWIDVVL